MSIFPQIRHDVQAACHAAQEMQGHRKSGPAALVSVCQGHGTVDGGVGLQMVCDESERGGRTEPDSIAAETPGDVDGRSADSRGGEQKRRTVSDDPEGLIGVEVEVAGGTRGVDDQFVGGQASGQAVDERFDTSVTGWKIVGDQ